MWMDRFWESWFSDKQLTDDWTSMHFRSWDAALSGLRGQKLRILEIGCWEGRSAIFWLEYFQGAHLTCVDTFAGGNKLPRTAERDAHFQAIEARFDANTSLYGERLRKIKKPSMIALAEMAAAGEMFDLIYIDGCHFMDEVLVDSLLSWSLLRTGGHIIWDDYLHGVDDLPPTKRPLEAIDLFIATHSGELEVISAGYQVIARRTESRLTEGPGVICPRTPDNLLRFMRRRPMRLRRIPR